MGRERCRQGRSRRRETQKNEVGESVEVHYILIIYRLSNVIKFGQPVPGASGG